MRAFAAVLIVIFIAACGTNAPSAPVSADAQKFANLKGDAVKGKQRSLERARRVTVKLALGCRGLGKDLTKSDFAKNLSDANFALFLAQGRPGSDPANTTKVDMPPRGGNPSLTDQDLMNIVAFVRTLQK